MMKLVAHTLSTSTGVISVISVMSNPNMKSPQNSHRGVVIVIEGHRSKITFIDTVIKHESDVQDH